MSTTRIKICGITRNEDAEYAQSLGVDALGFVLVPASKRAVSVEQARSLYQASGPFVTRVGLFLNARRMDIENALKLMPDLLPQFHGEESASFCNSFERPYLKALSVGSGMPNGEYLAEYENASGFLFDSNAAGELGGTGLRFDWNLLQEYSGKPLILAGGLDCANVQSAIQQVHPYALDVSTGVEQEKGVKSHSLMREFVEKVRELDS